MTPLQRRAAGYGVIIAAVIVLGILFRDRIAGMSQGQIASLVAATMALMLVLGPSISGRGVQVGRGWFGHLLIWAGIAAAIGLAYLLFGADLPGAYGAG